MSTIVVVLIAAAVIALAGAGVVLWLRREQARRLAEEARLEAQRELERTVEGGFTTVRAAFQTAARVREEGLGAFLRSTLDELAISSGSELPELRRMAARDGTVTILFSDIENSTAMNHELGDRAWVKVLGSHDAIVRRRVEAHDGHIVKSQGDGFMIAFASPPEALRCAVEVQQAITDGNRRLRKSPIRVRIGIHVGQAVVKDDDLFGRNVALAARVAGEATGGEILVSDAVTEKAGDVEGISFSAAREVELKGLPGTHRVSAVQWGNGS